MRGIIFSRKSITTCPRCGNPVECEIEYVSPFTKPRMKINCPHCGYKKWKW